MSFYEVLPTIYDEGTHQERLTASFTPNNGIRISIEDDDTPDVALSFDFSDEQAERIGQALVRWAQRHKAELEMIRCRMARTAG